MLSVCLSVRTFWHARSFVVSPRIDARFARKEAPVLGEHGVRFKMVLIHVVRRLQRFECQGVDRRFLLKTSPTLQVEVLKLYSTAVMWSGVETQQVFVLKKQFF